MFACRPWLLSLTALATALVAVAAGQDKPKPDDLAARLLEADKAALKKKLDDARKEYTDQAEALKAAVGTLLDKREEAARAKRDKKLVDRVAAERDAFKARGEPPAGVARGPLVAARHKLAVTYTDAVKDYTRLKLDDAAAAAEKERVAFLVESAALAGKKSYLSSLKHFNLKVTRGWFSNAGTAPTVNNRPLKLNGEPVPHTIFIHPPTRGAAQVSYNLAGKWAVLKTAVAVPRIELENTQNAVSPLTFEVLGDDKSLWKSEPTVKVGAVQECEVKVERVKVLTLRVHCPGSDGWGRAVWYEPVLIEP
jgi:hypothetical protein